LLAGGGIGRAFAAVDPAVVAPGVIVAPGTVVGAAAEPTVISATAVTQPPPGKGISARKRCFSLRHVV